MLAIAKWVNQEQQLSI